MGNVSTNCLKEKIQKILNHDQWVSKELEDDRFFTEKDKISFQCLIHDYYCEKSVHSITGKKEEDVVLCPYCQKKRNKYISIHLLKNLCKKYNLEYISLVKENLSLNDYSRITAKEYFYCKCQKHGIFKTCYDLITHGHLCPRCGNENKSNNALSFEELSQRFSQRNYTLLEVKRVDGKTHLYYTCQKHPETIQHILLSNFINGCGCRFCSESKGEREVKNFLSSQGIFFEPQKTFTDCKLKNELPFDFYLPDYNVCIEFQGKQHYEPVRYWNGDDISYQKALDNFSLQQKRDNIKKQFCQENDIKLVEISYKDYKKIEEILQEEIVNGTS